MDPLQSASALSRFAASAAGTIRDVNPPIAPWTLLHAGALGDLVLTLHLALRIGDVRRLGRITVASRADPGDLSDCNPAIDRTSLETMGTHWLHMDDARPAPSPLARLVSGRRVLNTLSGPGSPVHSRLLSLSPASLFSFDPQPRPDWRGHVTDQWRLDLERQGLLVGKCPYRRSFPLLHTSPRLRLNGAAILAAVCRSDSGTTSDPSRVILFHPGSGGVKKCWPLANFVAVARELHAAGRTPVFVLGPAELERWPPNRVVDLAREFATLLNPTPDDLAAVIASVPVLVGNDSGPSHLAALLGTQTLTIFGPTEPARWQPIGPRAVSIRGNPDGGDHWGIEPAVVVSRLLGA